MDACGQLQEHHANVVRHAKLIAIGALDALKLTNPGRQSPAIASPDIPSVTGPH